MPQRRARARSLKHPEPRRIRLVERCRRQQRVQILPQRLVLQPPEDALSRRVPVRDPALMVHHDQRILSRARDGAEPLLALAKCELHLPALGDVDMRANDAHRPALGIAGRHNASAHDPCPAARGRGKAELRGEPTGAGPRAFTDQCLGRR